MKSYEKESLLKNFFVFFSLLELLLVLLFLELFRTEKREYLHNLLRTMEVCSYTYECEQFAFDFVPKEQTALNRIYDANTAPYAFFPVPGSQKYHIKITYPADRYHTDLKRITYVLALKFAVATLVLMLVSLFFTVYTLNPIRKALKINDEFIKDILHDFNTPISSMVLNLKMFKEEYGDNLFVRRIKHSIDSILLLQNNLRCFLHNSPNRNTRVDIGRVAKERVDFMQNLYPNITFRFTVYENSVKYTNAEILTRIFDNLLSNAAKYNKPDGKVTVTLYDDKLVIEDTGKGIENVREVMQRYRKEQERGIGIGLHIVQKLTQELNIPLQIRSVPKEGTVVTLDFKYLEEATS